MGIKECIHEWKKLLPTQVVTGRNAATQINTSMSCLIPELVGFGTTLAQREKMILRPQELISWYFAKKKIDLLCFFCSAHSIVSGHHCVCSSVQASSNFWLHKIFPHFSFTLLLSFLNILFLSDFLFTANNYFLSWRLRIVPKLEKQSRFSKRSSQGSLCHRNAPSTRKGSFTEVIFSETPVLLNTLQWWREGGCTRRSYQTRSWCENLQVFFTTYLHTACVKDRINHKCTRKQKQV